MVSVGLVGLPNVGKSSLFNALTAGAAQVSNYPFTTLDSNVGVVAVPDPRLARLAELLAPEETTPAHVEFIDIAGLVEGASRGEGLGNRFLAAIREVDAVAHVVRAFAGTDVAHVFGAVDPVRDVAVVETELMLADLELLSRAAEKRERTWKADPRGHEAERLRLAGWRRALEAGRPLSALGLDREARAELTELGLLTGKPVLFVANVAEEDLTAGGAAAATRLAAALASGLPGAAERWPEGGGPEVVAISARLEAELAELSPVERGEFMAALGVDRSGLERLVERSFELLGLVRFYTVANRKLRAWEVPRGTPAPVAAGKIHSDMERGFIRAQVAAFADLEEHGSFAELARHGLVRTEGRGYEIADGDVVEFLFQP